VSDPKGVAMEVVNDKGTSTTSVGTAGLAVGDDDGKLRTYIGGASGVLLIDKDGTPRLSADTAENYTQLSLMNSKGQETCKLKGNDDAGTVITYDGSGNKLVKMEEGLQINDGDTEAASLTAFGMQTFDPEGKVTFSVDKTTGQVAAKAAVSANQASIDVNGPRQSKASFCTTNDGSYPSKAACKACASTAARAAMDRLSVTKPTQTDCSSVTGAYTKPTDTADGKDSTKDEAIEVVAVVPGGGSSGGGSSGSGSKVTSPTRRPTKPGSKPFGGLFGKKK